MNQIMVVFWSQTGNTEAMANAVAERHQGGRKGCSGNRGLPYIGRCT